VVLAPGARSSRRCAATATTARSSRCRTRSTSRATARAGSRAAARHGVPADAPLLVYVGRMGQEKGLPMLLEAFAAARASEPDLHLLMVGDGPLRAPLSARGPPARALGGAGRARRVADLPDRRRPVRVRVGDRGAADDLPGVAGGGTPVVAVESAAARDLQDSGGLTMSGADADDLPRIDPGTRCGLPTREARGARRAPRHRVRRRPPRRGARRRLRAGVHAAPAGAGPPAPARRLGRCASPSTRSSRS
jgi:hypothetical protein